MRLGCGCLLVLLLLLAAVATAGWAVWNALGEPAVPRAVVTPADALRAQQKIYSIVSRSARGRPVVLSEAELNAFLERNLVDAVDLTVTDLRVDVAGPDRVRFTGRTTVGALLAEVRWLALHDVVPAAWRSRPAWIDLVARPSTEARGERRRYLRLDVREFRIGRQRVPAVLAKLILEPGALGLLRWPLPQAIEEITIEPGRVVVRTAS